MAKDKYERSTKDIFEGDKTALSAGAALAAKRKIVTHTCPVCGEDFEGTLRAKFCSNRCKQKDKNDRSKAKQV